MELKVLPRVTLAKREAGFISKVWINSYLLLGSEIYTKKS